MDRFTSLTVFTQVAEAESFSAAARRLNMSVTMVSNHIQALEERLGARLFTELALVLGWWCGCVPTLIEVLGLEEDAPEEMLRRITEQIRAKTEAAVHRRCTVEKS